MHTQDSIDDLAKQADTSLSFTKGLSPSRTYKEALSVAQDAIKMLDEVNTTRSSKPRTVNPFDVQYIIDGSSTRSAEISDTLMYVFNFDDDAGFAVVSANRATEELIAVTEQGNYIAGEETENEGFNMYMDMATAYVLDSFPKVGFPEPGPGTLMEYKAETVKDTISFGPYITVRWGQEWPYNNYCYTLIGEKAYAGCVAIAIAQIMSYYRYPERLLISYDYSNNIEYLSWENILQHKQSFYSLCACSTSSMSHHQIAQLVRQIGCYVFMDYGAVGDTIKGGSGAYSEDVYNALDYLGYKSDVFQLYSFEKVLSSLSSQKLIYMRGQRPSGGGHAWVIDGAQQITTTRTEYTRPQGSPFWDILEQHIYVDKYNHINWGWNGACNGYYLSTVFDTSLPHRLDSNSSTTGSINYTINLQIYPNIEIDN